MNTVCAGCQALNCLPGDRSADDIRCGRCGHDPFGGDVINAIGTTLDKLLKNDLSAAADFWTPQRDPCRSFTPIFEDVAEECSGKVHFAKVNIEAERELSARFRIRSILTIMIFKNDEVIDTLNGTVPKAPLNS